MRLGNLGVLFRLGPRRIVYLLCHLKNFLKLFQRLMKDGRVPLRSKLLLILVLAYILAPVDLLPDVLVGPGQLDDLVVLLLGLKEFIRLCPPEVVREHVQTIAAGR